MEFTLTDALLDDIQFYMENQTDTFFVDSVENAVVSMAEIENGPTSFNSDDPDDFEDDSADADRYYELPQWGPVEGFRLMEHFTGSLHNPPAKEELHRVLDCGRGVFRNFKNVLQKHPGVEELWYAFKDTEMKQVIRDWYDNLRTAWGLEKLGSEPEETDDVLKDDFIFSDRSSLSAESILQSANEEMLNELENRFEKPLGRTAVALWKNLQSLCTEQNSITITAETLAGDFAGCIQTCSVPPSCPDTHIITLLYVKPEFRGLGIARELINRSSAAQIKAGAVLTVCTNTIVPEHFISVLRKTGFKDCGSAFVLYLNETGSIKQPV
jgi:GNAT superfamily N-acetyltransferase